MLKGSNTIQHNTPDILKVKNHMIFTIDADKKHSILIRDEKEKNTQPSRNRRVPPCFDHAPVTNIIINGETLNVFFLVQEQYRL